MIPIALNLAAKAVFATIGIAYGVLRGLQLSAQPAPAQDRRVFLTREEFQTAMAAMEVSVDEKLQAQTLAVGALREMLENTDVLLNAVLERLQAAETSEESLATRR